ncbi:GNAT family N-acetyltransferase [Paenibacillus sp. p3-SID867]|uniref:GNAT family N-acetyltransferase n=1 Tax=Paenibacillus sp. p3-SID867 TaxID=2916363 RepID=UPI0021A79643|nr:GNAT family N-acetyltransferase [Paenibacillus sp. p3-SID867]MCT1400407.1 GNAT family N-acetyltransferase [Paenibacillus sp. p3-SID867]
MMVSIRRIHYDDLDDLILLYEELDESTVDAIKMKSLFLKIQENDLYYLLGAKNEEGSLIGSVMGIQCYDLTGDCNFFMMIENLIISSAYRRKGIGKQLIMRIEEIAIERGCHFITLVTGSKKAESHKFYKSLGYEDGIIKGFYKSLPC